MSSNIRPLGDDILLKFRTTHSEKLSEGGIYLKEEQDSQFEYYEVVAVGPDVKIVSVGDTVMTTWARITPPFKHEGEKYGVTSEKEIWAIIDEEE